MDTLEKVRRPIGSLDIASAAIDGKFHCRAFSGMGFGGMEVKQIQLIQGGKTASQKCPAFFCPRRNTESILLEGLQTCGAFGVA